MSEIIRLKIGRRAGEIVEAQTGAARNLIDAGQADAVTPAERADFERDRDTLENGDPDVMHRDPTPRRRR